MTSELEINAVAQREHIPLWYERKGGGAIFATALHAGHLLCPELQDKIALDEAARLREEDPYTDDWATRRSGRSS